MSLQPHLLLTDHEFETQFALATLDPALFTHEAHLRLAWIHLSKYGETAAISNITQQLQQYVAKLGKAEKYHATLTIAAIKAVYHFMQKCPAPTFSDFISANPRLNFQFSDIIGQHYGFDLMHSTTARTTYLEPDLLAFS